MPNVAEVLKQEITRLARKEARAGYAQLKKQVSNLTATVSKNKKTITQLEKNLSRLSAQLAKGGKSVEALSEETQPKARITSSSIKRQRARLKLSQAQFGKLLNVSTNTIVRWEAGKSAPRARHKAEIAKLRDLGIREVKKTLAGNK